MGLKTFTISVAELSKDSYLRNDEKYHIFLSQSDWNLFDTSNDNLISLKDILSDDYTLFDYQEDGEYKGIPTGQTYLDEDGEIKEFQPISTEDHPGRLKYKVSNDNILISSLRLAKSPALFFENEDLSEYVFSNGFYIFKVNDDWNNKFVLYILRTKKLKSILDNHIYRGIGISAYKKEDLLKIKIPLIAKPKQDQIVIQIEPIEKKIKELKAQISQPQEVINKVFAREFGFDLENADEKKKNMVHYSSLIDVANEELKFDISLKYRFIFNKYVKNPSKNEWIELGKVVEVKGGKRLPKGQNITEEDTGFKYVRVDDLSWSGIFDLENIKYISEENHKKIKNYISKENDILLTIVGATVGKCGLVPLELDGENITENFARLIILDKDKYLPEYINYCLQSKTSVYQIDEYKGRSSQGKLALFRIKKIKIPNIKPELQQKIVDEIKAELDKQEEIKNKIESERNKIDEIIEKAIKNS